MRELEKLPTDSTGEAPHWFCSLPLMLFLKCTWWRQSFNFERILTANVEFVCLQGILDYFVFSLTVMLVEPYAAVDVCSSAYLAWPLACACITAAVAQLQVEEVWGLDKSQRHWVDRGERVLYFSMFRYRREGVGRRKRTDSFPLSHSPLL